MRGKVVVVPFPFSDLSDSKRRPALVVADLTGDDLILCQITSQNARDHYAVPISDSDFSTGNLNRKSNVRPNRLFTADSKIIAYEIGELKTDKFSEIIEVLVGIITGKL
jgi:mRNA interferase MazF